MRRKLDYIDCGYVSVSIIVMLPVRHGRQRCEQLPRSVHRWMRAGRSVTAGNDGGVLSCRCAAIALIGIDEWPYPGASATNFACTRECESRPRLAARAATFRLSKRRRPRPKNAACYFVWVTRFAQFVAIAGSCARRCIIAVVAIRRPRPLAGRRRHKPAGIG